MMAYLKKGKLSAAMCIVVIVTALAIFSCNLYRDPDSDAIHPGFVHSDIELNLFKDVQCMFDSIGLCDEFDEEGNPNPDYNPDGMQVMAVLAMFADMALEAYPALGECEYFDERAVNFIRSHTKDSGEYVRFINADPDAPTVCALDPELACSGNDPGDDDCIVGGNNYGPCGPETITITYDEPHDPDFPYYYYGFGNDEPEEAPFVEMFHFDNEYTLTTTGGPDLGATVLENIVHTPEDFDLEAYWDYGMCYNSNKEETPCDYNRPYDKQNCGSVGICSGTLDDDIENIECVEDDDCNIGRCEENEEVECEDDGDCVGEGFDYGSCVIVDYGPCQFCVEHLGQIDLTADGGFRINTCPKENEPDRDMLFKWSPGSPTSTYFTVELRVTEATNVVGMVQCNAVDINQEIKIPHELIQLLPEGEAAFGAFRIREVYQEGFADQYWMGRSTLSVEGEATTYPGCSQDCTDADGDDYTDEACGGDDCDDTNADVNPGATEGPFEDQTCEDDLDNDCDDMTDLDDDDCVD
ncbi:hypothetical protein ACFL4G_03325 [Thermodesulfobacteriota bacterium]